MQLDGGICARLTSPAFAKNTPDITNSNKANHGRVLECGGLPPLWETTFHPEIFPMHRAADLEVKISGSSSLRYPHKARSMFCRKRCAIGSNSKRRRGAALHK